MTNVRKFFLGLSLLLWLAAGVQSAGAQVLTWTIFTNQVPDQTLDATPGWEVGTRFTSSHPGKIVGFRFWRASGETGSNYAKLWSNSGQQLRVSNAFPSGTGWVEVYLSSPYTISANTTYRVSVNTNTKQVKRGGAYVFDGPISNGPLYSDGGYYGQPLNAMPTSQSASMYFIDVIFEEPAPLPDLYIGDINPFSGSKVVISVCNGGNADVTTYTYTRLAHWKAPLPTGPGAWQVIVDIYTPGPIPAGQCKPVEYASPSPVGYHHEYHVNADSTNRVVESNENNNGAVRYWDRWQ